MEAFAVAIAALAALVPAAHAQMVAKPTQAPVSEARSTDDPAKVAAAREFLKAYRPRLNPAFVSAQMDKVQQQVAENLKKEDPKADVKAVMAKRRAAVLARIDTQLDNQAHMVAPYFTLPELKALTAFFNHGVGKKLIDATPKIQMEMMRRQAVARGLPGSGNPGAMQLKPLNATKASPNPPTAPAPQKK
jgi:hypothetical protein